MPGRSPWVPPACGGGTAPTGPSAPLIPQSFLSGTWHGTVTAGGEQLEVDGVLGFAEDVRNRW